MYVRDLADLKGALRNERPVAPMSRRARCGAVYARVDAPGAAHVQRTAGLIVGVARAEVGPWKDLVFRGRRTPAARAVYVRLLAARARVEARAWPDRPGPHARPADEPPPRWPDYHDEPSGRSVRATPTAIESNRRRH